MSNSAREIVKIGVAVTADKRLLLVRKKGGSSYILPGGKPEAGENDHQALAREVAEELGCTLDINSLDYLGSFSDVAADLKDTVVIVRLYAAQPHLFQEVLRERALCRVDWPPFPLEHRNLPRRK